ncbi:MAG: tryptophan-rich sensory protein [Ardenticatenaceae bacterium]|nr:tryptophan-rich sensory protein [Ardenticatenaceae bacterium]
MNTLKEKISLIQVANILAFAVAIIVNVLSNVLPLNGRTAEQVSDALPSYFTPAGYTFAIWGLIYTALLGYVIFQALPAQRERPFQAQIGWLFVVSSIANAAWLFAWHYGTYLLSVLIIVTLLVALIAVYLRLDIGRSNPQLTTSERIFVHFPFSLYLGWITVATIANVSSVLAHFGFSGLGMAGPVWSAIMMAVAVVVAGVLLFNRRNLAYAGVLIWALFGIRAAYPEMGVIANTAVIAAILIAVLALIGYWRTRQPEPVAQTQARPA